MNSAGQSLNNDLQEISDRNDSNILVTNDGNNIGLDLHRSPSGFQSFTEGVHLVTMLVVFMTNCMNRMKINSDSKYSCSNLKAIILFYLSSMNDSARH